MAHSTILVAQYYDNKTISLLNIRPHSTLQQNELKEKKQKQQQVLDDTFAMLNFYLYMSLQELQFDYFDFFEFQLLYTYTLLFKQLDHQKSQPYHHYYLRM